MAGKKKLENDGRAKKITLLGNGTYRILADLHYCRQTVKTRLLIIRSENCYISQLDVKTFVYF